MAIGRAVVLRVLLAVPTLLGISLATFVMMEVAPADRASVAIGEMNVGDSAARREALHRLRVNWGLVDAQTGEARSVWRRYGAWLARAVRLDFVGPGEDPHAFRARILAALPVTLLVNFLALLVALGIALPLGSWLGMSIGSAADRVVGVGLFIVYGLPEFLLATLLLLVFGGGFFAEILPASGLRSPQLAETSALRQLLDLAAHLVMPVATLAVGPCVIVTRFLRDSVARVSTSEFVVAMRGLGLPERHVRRSVLRNGMAPVVTLLGTLLPTLVGGSVVVESVFSLPGLGRLAFDAMQAREYPMVMALTLLVSVVTLASLLVSDLLHRAVDPRVELR